MTTASATPTVCRGAILAYRIYEAGDAIALDVAEQRLAGSCRVDLGGPLVEGLVLASRPLEIALGAKTLNLPAQGPLATRAFAHLFDFGAVAIRYELTVEEGTPLASLTPLCDALYDAAELDRAALELVTDVVAKLGDAVSDPHTWSEAESYTIVFAEEIRGQPTNDLATSEVVAKLLLGETSTKPLSQAVKDEVLKNSFSYLADDLVVVDWNSALVVEPNGSRVVPHVLELATAQLLEFRYYDGVVERELGRLYDHVERARPRIFRSPYGVLTRDVLRRYMELTEVTERVDNAIKWMGDFYLARIYLAAIRRFRVPEWRESVEAKLALVGRAYELLKGEVEISRSQLLEIIVIVLIFIELVSAFTRH